RRRRVGQPAAHAPRHPVRHDAAAPHVAHPHRRLADDGDRPQLRLMDRDFDRLVHEASIAPADTWDFGWLEGRAVEERPSWRYFDRVAERAPGARRLLDLDAGTGNLLADLPRLPPLAVAADGYAPSVDIAGPRLHARGA